MFVEFPTIVSAILGLRQAGLKKHITVFSPALEDGWTAHVDARGLTYEHTHTHTHTHTHISIIRCVLTSCIRWDS